MLWLYYFLIMFAAEPVQAGHYGKMIYRELTAQEYADARGRILYEDNHLLAVNKRPGEIVQADKTEDETLADLYRAYIAKRDGKEGAVFIGIPHRLDRPVSGVTVFAKTSKALERMNAMFRNGEIHKFYWALVCDRPEPAEAELSDWLVRNEKQNKSYIYTGRPELKKDAKLARLRYRTIGSTDRYWLVEVELLTGRHHQIRCQLAGTGCVIKGDLKYGAQRSNPDGCICLHARRINFVHPVRKTEMTIEAPLPDSWSHIAMSALHYGMSSI